MCKSQCNPSWASLLLLVALSLHWAGAHAECTTPVSLDPQTLQESLNEIIRLTSCDIIFLGQDVEQFEAATIISPVPIEVALDRLLRGTGLVPNKKTDAEGFSISAMSEERQAAPKPTVQTAESGTKSPENPPRVDEVVVAKQKAGPAAVESEVLNTAEAPQYVYRRWEIERSGAGNAGMFLRQILTSSTSYQGGTQLPNELGNAFGLALRGFGSKETLLMVDGRQLARYSMGNGFYPPNIDSIPAADIDHIDVYSPAEAFRFGPGANGGAIDIVTRRDYPTLETTLVYGDGFKTDTPNSQIDLLSGWKTKDMRTSWGVNMSVARDAGMLVEQLDDAGKVSADQFYSRYFPSAGSPPSGTETNVLSSNGDYLTGLDGTQFMASYLTIPKGFTGFATQGYSPLLRGAGTYNLDTVHTAQSGVQSRGALQSLVNDSKIVSIGSFARSALIPGTLEGFAEASFAEKTAQFAYNGATSFSIPSGVPGNPFHQDIKITTPAYGANQQVETVLRSSRAILGTTYLLSDLCRVTAEYTFGNNTYSTTGAADLNVDAATADMANGTLNVFRDTSIFNTNFGRYLLPHPRIAPAVETLNDLSLHLDKPCAIAASWPINVDANIRYRRENIDSFSSIQYTSDAAIEEHIPGRAQVTESAYLGITLPISSKYFPSALVDSADFEIAGHLDLYNITAAAPHFRIDDQQIGSENTEEHRFRAKNFRVGLRITSLRDLTLRGGISTAFVPPDVNELVSDPLLVSPLTFLADPLRGGEKLGEVAYIAGGNPDLNPEISNSVFFGLDLTPRFVRNLRLSLDWTRTSKRDNILTLSIDQPSLNLVSIAAPDRIQRDTPAPGDVFAVGPITGLNLTRINVERHDVETCDFAIDYTGGVGRFGSLALRAKATYIRTNRIRVGVPVADIVQQDLGTELSGNEGLGILKWRANATVEWAIRNTGLLWTTRYLSAYCTAEGCATQDARIPSQIYHDVLINITPFTATGFSSSAYLQIGIKNLFDREPPWDYDSQMYSPLADPKRKTFFVTVRASLD